MSNTVRDIITEYLIAHGYDGLYDDGGDCACSVEDIGSCGEMSPRCTGGFIGPDTTGEGDFGIGPRRTSRLMEGYE